MSNNPLLFALAERVEGASGDDQRHFIEQAAAQLALHRLWPPKGDDAALVARFFAFLNAGAFLDAAMTLANGMGGQVTFFKDGTAKAVLWQPYPMAVEAKAATPALALCASAIRALATSEPE